MANALIYGTSGSGKTVNSTRVVTGKRGKNLLLCSDNSHVVLKNFSRPNLDIEVIEHWYFKDKKGQQRTCFNTQFEVAIESKKYDNIIADNLSDIFDLGILEMDESGDFRDPRQAYQLIYQSLKRIARKAGQLDCNVIFTAWEDNVEITLQDGTRAIRTQPKLPAKIIDNICGLCNLVAHISTANDKEGNKQWYYVTEGTPLLYAKNQLTCAKSCMPEDIFSGKAEK